MGRLIMQPLPIILLSICCVCSYVHGAYNIDDSAGLGRRFDGIGGVSGGGATSKLLVSYPDSIRKQILDYLFLPNFAASLQILKVEIGGDAQSTDGTESSHMHESWDENYKRGYEWWLMVEAKKRNPAIKLYGLPWAFPGWVGRGSNNPYKYPVDTATYVLKWVLAAKKYYNLEIDYLGIWNERDYDKIYVETLRGLLDKNGLSNVGLVVGDGDWGVSHDVLNDTAFAAAVSYLGCHYPGTVSTNDSVKTGKPLWSSEDYSTFNDNVGAGCWARILNQNYVNGYMTSTLSWNLIAAYYEALPFGRDGLMTAQEPWSGHYVVDNPIWITAHTTQFTAIGWTYLGHGSGVGKLEAGGSYVSLTNQDKSHLTIVIETMSHDHSICIRPSLPAYNVTAQEAEFALSGSFMNINELHVWKTQLTYNGKSSSTVFARQPSIKLYMGMFTITLEPDQVYTLTTLPGGIKGDYGSPPDSKPFPFPYSDDFESYDPYSEAYNFAPQSGVWEVIDTSDPRHKKINRQVVLNDPIYWCATKPSTMNLGGDASWKDVMIFLDVFVPTINGSGGAYVAARVDRGGCDAGASRGIFFNIFTTNNSFVVASDSGFTKVLAKGNIAIPVKNDTWYTLTLIVKGYEVIGLINNTQLLFHVSAPKDIKTSGFVAYGSPRLGLADFDNLVIQSPDSEWINLLMYKPQPEISSSQNDAHFYRFQNQISSSNSDVHFYPFQQDIDSSKNDVHFFQSKPDVVSYKNRISAANPKQLKNKVKSWQKL